MKDIKILVLEQKSIICDGIAALLDNHTGYIVASRTGRPSEALSLMDKVEIDVVLVSCDIHGSISVIDFVKGVTSRYPSINILLFSHSGNIAYIERILRSGARGCIVSDDPTATLIRAVEIVAKGERFISDKISSILYDSVFGQKGGKLIDDLSDRELEVFRLVGEGSTSNDIGKDLNLSVKTVDSHKLHIRNKLGIKSSTELIKTAVLWRNDLLS